MSLSEVIKKLTLGEDEEKAEKRSNIISNLSESMLPAPMHMFGSHIFREKKEESPEEKKKNLEKMVGNISKMMLPAPMHILGQMILSGKKEKKKNKAEKKKDKKERTQEKLEQAKASEESNVPELPDSEVTEPIPKIVSESSFGKAMNSLDKASNDSQVESTNDPVSDSAKVIPFPMKSAANEAIDPKHNKEPDLLENLISRQTDANKKLDQIVENTTVNKQKAREDEIEAKSKVRLDAVNGHDKNAANDPKGGSGLMGMLGDALTSYLGLKGLGGALGKGTGGLKGVVAGKLSGLKNIVPKSGILSRVAAGAGAIATSAKATFSPVATNVGSSVAAPLASKTMAERASSLMSTLKSKTGNVASSTSGFADKAKAAITPVSSFASNAFSKTKDILSGAAEKSAPMLTKSKDVLKSAGSGIKSGAGKLLGLPLTAALTAYDALNISNDETKSSSEKNVEYTKLGGRIAGMIAGAKAGAMVGGVGGAAFGGVGAAPGALIGGIVGGIGGAWAGEKIGDSVGTGVFGEEAKKEVANVEINPIQSDTAKLTSLLTEQTDSLPANVKAYVSNDDKNVSDIKVVKDQFKEYLEKKGITATDSAISNSLVSARGISFNKKVDVTATNSKPEISVTPNTPVDYGKILSPMPSNLNNVSSMNVGETRNQVLQNLNTQIDQNHGAAETLKNNSAASTVIIAKGGNNSTSTPSNDEGSKGRVRLGVPNVRNQDDTIQRLLNATYKPLME